MPRLPELFEIRLEVKEGIEKAARKALKKLPIKEVASILDGLSQKLIRESYAPTKAERARIRSLPMEETLNASSPGDSVK